MADSQYTIILYQLNNTQITTLKGVGEKTGKLFGLLGVSTIDDLINFYPIRFIPYEKLISIEEATVGEDIAVSAMLSNTPHTIRAGKLKITEATIEDYSGKLRCVWYNSPYMASSIHKGDEYVFAGKLVSKKNHVALEHPIIYKKEEYIKLAGKLKPIYRLTKGLSQKLVQKSVQAALSEYAFSEDYLPLDIKERYELIEQDKAIIKMHNAENENDIRVARKRLVFDEFFNFIYSINKLKKSDNVAESEFNIFTNGIYDEFTSKLPYKLTDDQKKAVDDIFRDFDSKKIVNRLIQGDVGSGKTVVSLIALYAAYKSGYQGVIMVPTEVLANQHFRTCEKIFENFEDKPRIGLLTGSMTAREKKQMHDDIEHGQVDIIIGTHALIQENVAFKDLALVITDEQHRFGVRQRELLSNKGKKPHVLVMSATPIPRTLAVILYGDLDISTIFSKPSGRLAIKNAVIGAKDRGKAYRTILNEINAGHQAYIICPMVEDSEAIEAENVIDYTEKIRGIFPENIVIQFLHGRMKQEEKDKIMCSFVEGNTNILVSTTVVEVGVDVPNATVMMIENAERYGLATLHQLRGRVGRGDDQSYCIFVRTNDSELARQRLEVVGNSNDGFHIASEDLKLRGPGEILGQAQSGQMRFDIADVFADSEILMMAKDCYEYVESDVFKPDDDEIIRFNKHMEDYRDKRLNNLSI